MTNSAPETHHQPHEAVQRYLPDLFKRLALTYGIPMLLILVVNTLLGVLLSGSIPRSTFNIISFGSSLVILVQGWRYLEARTNATALFIAYTQYSRARRKDLQDEAETAAQEFITQAQQAGLTPHER